MTRKKFSKSIRKQVFDKCGGKCAYCGCKLKTFDIDHIDPLHLKIEHPHRIENLNPSCFQCNNFKGGLTLEEFREKLSLQIEKARCYSVNFRMAEKYGLVKVKHKPISFLFENDIQLSLATTYPYTIVWKLFNHDVKGLSKMQEDKEDTYYLVEGLKDEHS